MFRLNHAFIVGSLVNKLVAQRKKVRNELLTLVNIFFKLFRNFSKFVPPYI